MKRMKRLWAPLLLGVLLIATLVGAASARPGAAPLAAPTKVLTVSGADCYPQLWSTQYNNNGVFIKGVHGTPNACYICPVNFHDYGNHKIIAISMTFLDKVAGGGNDIAATFYRTIPSWSAEQLMGTLAPVGSWAVPQGRTIAGSAMTNRVIYPTTGMYIWICMPGHNDILVYGFRINYLLV